MSKSFNAIYAALILVPLFALYLLSMPTSLPDFDAGEFAVVAVKGGVAHPPGYPLLIILFRIAAQFREFFGLVQSLSLASVLCTVAAGFLILKILFFQTQSYWASAFGVYGAFLAAPVWRSATAIEPFGLNFLLASICLYAFWGILKRNDEKEDKQKWFFIAGAGFGLAFCNHHSISFFLPFAALAWWFGPPQKTKNLLWFIGGALSGLTPLLYFFSNFAQGPYVWGNWEQPLRRLPIHLFRSEYGTFSLISNSEGYWYTGVLFFGETLFTSLSFLFFFFFIIGIVYLLRYRIKRFPSISLFYFGLGITFFLTGMVFGALFKIDNIPWHKAVAERFYALPLVLLSFPIAFSGKWLQVWWDKKVVTVLLLGIFISFHTLLQWPASDRSAETFYESHIRNVFGTVEENAVILTRADTNFFGLLFGQHILDLKPDATLLQIGLWEGWYRNRFLAKNNLDQELKSGKLSEIVNFLMRDRPVYACDLNEKMAPFFHSFYPIGPLLRLTRDKEAKPTPLSLFRLNKSMYENYLTIPRFEEVEYFSVWEFSLLIHYMRTWEILQNALQEQGRVEEAGFSRYMANRFSIHRRKLIEKASGRWILPESQVPLEIPK